MSRLLIEECGYPRVIMATNGKDETKAAEPKKTCFVVCPIGSEISPQRKHSDQALRHIIRPALLEAGFEEPARADKISETGNITRQIINHIREDDLVVADLTGHNPNVFYELAIRHCTGKPFIQMIRKDENIPFDLGPMRTIFFDLTDPDDVVSAREELARQVASAMAEGAQVDTPIGAAMDFEKLRSGGGTAEHLLSDLIERVDALSRTQNRLYGMPQVMQQQSYIMAKDLIRKHEKRTGITLNEGAIEPLILAVLTKSSFQADGLIRVNASALDANIRDWFGSLVQGGDAPIKGAD